MKILRIIVSADLRHGGPMEGAMRVGAELARRGHHYDLATLDPPGARCIADAPCRVIGLGERAVTPDQRLPFLQRYGYAPRAVPWLREHLPDYDVAIVSGLWNYATMAARRALVGSGVPYVVFPHGMLDPWFRETYPLKHAVKQLLWLGNEGVLLRHAEAVLFTSEEERLRARGAFRPYRVRERVVGYGTGDVSGDPAAQVAAFRGLLPALGDRRYLLFLSRIHEKKGIDLLLDAYAGIAARRADLDLVIAGPDQVGLKATLEARAAALGIAPRIHWPGMLRGDAKFGAMRAAEAFVLPSHQENFGIVVAEAMACGRPVLITDKVNIWREILADEAALVAPDTAAGIADLLDRYLALDPAAREAMGTRARASFLRRFGIAHAADDLLAALHAAAS